VLKIEKPELKYHPAAIHLWEGLRIIDPFLRNVRLEITHPLGNALLRSALSRSDKWQEKAVSKLGNEVDISLLTSVPQSTSTHYPQRIMQLGISYYPEYYPPSLWDRHFQIVAEGGFKRVRFGESSWASFQPANNEFRWEVLDSAIEKAASFGIEVVLGTPTYVPPLWLVQEHPDVLPVGSDGRRTVFGARQHRCFNAPAYVEAADRIVGAMVQRYGRHPNVVAWQIDNELGGEQKRCYCEHCLGQFQQFLQTRYGTIEELNRRWNTAFWGQRYARWEDVPVPLKVNADLPMRHHPSLELDFQRFSSDSIVRFCDRQFDIMREHTDRPITHNTDTFYWGDNVNVHHLFKKLDVAGMDVYSDRPFEIAFYSDLTRSVSKGERFWMMEYSTLSPRLTQELDLAADHGCEWFYLFKMLPFTCGQEMDRNALLKLSGTPQPNYHKVRAWAAEHAMPKAACQAPSRVALLYDFDSSWAYWIDQWRGDLPIPERQVYPKYIVETVYRALFEAGLGVDIVFDPVNLERYDLVVAARQLVHKPAIEKALAQYVHQGGRLIVTSDLFRRNEDNAWLERVTPTYPTLLGWTGVDFPDDSAEADSWQILTHHHGKGKTIMLHREAQIDAWQQILQDCFSASGPATSQGNVLRHSSNENGVYDQRGGAPRATHATV